jgi:hypothetical protein
MDSQKPSMEQASDNDEIGPRGCETTDVKPSTSNVLCRVCRHRGAAYQNTTYQKESCCRNKNYHRFRFLFVIKRAYTSSQQFD